MDQLALPLFEADRPVSLPGGGGALPAGCRRLHTLPDLPRAQRQPARARWECVFVRGELRAAHEFDADCPCDAYTQWRSGAGAALLAAPMAIVAADAVVLTDTGHLVDGDDWQLRIRLTVPEVESRLQALCQRAQQAQRASDAVVLGALGGAEIDYMTRDERAARHYLLSMLPLAGELAEAARKRIRARLAARRAGAVAAA